MAAAPVGIYLADRDGALLLSSAENNHLWGEHPMSRSVAEYRAWKGWWADGSERHGQPVPLAGDVFDMFWRSNTRNLRIIRKHLDKHHPGTIIIDQ